MTAERVSLLTPEEYLAGEQVSAIKHEYVAGQVYAMAGTTRPHNTLVINLVMLLGPHLQGSDCSLYAADVKLRIEAADVFYYPDVMVTCDPEDRASDIVVQRPRLVVEVLSDSTEWIDRGRKFRHYWLLESLEEYVLVEQREPRVEVYRRSPAGGWQLQVFTADEELVLNSVNLQCSVGAIYTNVPLQDPAVIDSAAGS